MINQKLTATVLLFALTTKICGLAVAGEHEIESKRIVTAGGSITEIMFALELGERIIAVDTSSSYPSEVTALPKVGYFRSLAAEGIMSLNPDMLVAANGAGPEVVLGQLAALGVNVSTYDQSNYTLESWQTLVRDIGRNFDRLRAANELIESVTTGIKKHQKTRNYSVNNINAITLLSIGQRGPIAAGRNTVPDLSMRLAGLNNAADVLDGYKPLNTELLAEQKIDMLLVPSHVVDGLGGENAICANQVIKMATSNKCNLFVMDGLLLMGFGARLDQAIGEIINFANGV